MNNFYFKGGISWILVPLFIFLYIYFKKSRNILFYPSLLVAIFGIWNLFLTRKNILKYRYGLFQFILIFLFHFVLLLPLLEFKKYSHTNVYSFALILFGIIILKFLPWWPYEGFTRNNMILLIIIMTIVLNIFFYALRTEYKYYLKN